MAQKNATPTRQQAAYIRRSGRDPRLYTVIREQSRSLIVMDRRDKSVSLIKKGDGELNRI